MRSKLNISYFPERLRAQRKMKGLTQQQLHEKTGISVKTINTWETSNPKDGSGPKVSNIIVLCEALECDFEYLFGGIDTPIKAYADIQAETGLSIDAVKELCERKKGAVKTNDSFLDVLSSIILYGFHIGHLYVEYKKAAYEYDNRNAVYKQMKPKCDSIEMSKKEFYELLQFQVKEAEYKIILDVATAIQRGCNNGKHKED